MRAKQWESLFASARTPPPGPSPKKTLKKRGRSSPQAAGRIQAGWHFVYGIEGAKMNAGVPNAEYTTETDSLALTTLFPTAEKKKWMCSLVDSATTLALWMVVVPAPKDSAATKVVFLDVPCQKHPRGTLTVVYKEPTSVASSDAAKGIIFIASLLYHPGPSSSELLASEMEAALLKEDEERPLKRAKK